MLIADVMDAANPEGMGGMYAGSPLRCAAALTCGSDGNIVRIMAPITIPDAVTDEGLSIFGAVALHGR